VDIQILVGLLLTILPTIELRAGLPVVVEYAIRNGVPIWPYFLIVIVLNVLLILFIFMFLDFLHDVFMRMKWYRAVIGGVLRNVQGKAEKIKNKMDRWGYFALMFFVAVPLPGTGAWSGAMVAWIMGLDRLRSFIAIAAGVIIAGSLMLLISIGIFA